MYTNFLADPQTLGGILASQIAWSIIYLPIIRYIELIFPGDYGAPLPFYFPLMVT
jgi:ATP-binding cassette subfamily A (ABC1) protein 3